MSGSSIKDKTTKLQVLHLVMQVQENKNKFKNLESKINIFYLKIKI